MINSKFIRTRSSKLSDMDSDSPCPDPKGLDNKLLITPKEINSKTRTKSQKLPGLGSDSLSPNTKGYNTQSLITLYSRRQANPGVEQADSDRDKPIPEEDYNKIGKPSLNIHDYTGSGRMSTPGDQHLDKGSSKGGDGIEADSPNSPKKDDDKEHIKNPSPEDEDERRNSSEEDMKEETKEDNEESKANKDSSEPSDNQESPHLIRRIAKAKKSLPIKKKANSKLRETNLSPSQPGIKTFFRSNKEIDKLTFKPLSKPTIRKLKTDAQMSASNRELSCWRPQNPSIAPNPQLPPPKAQLQVFPVGKLKLQTKLRTRQTKDEDFSCKPSLEPSRLLIRDAELNPNIKEGDNLEKSESTLVNGQVT